MFKEVPSQFDFPAMEKEILAFWEANRIHEQSLRQREGCKPFVFFEGPPTANGLPHPGHCLTRAMKDVFPRFKTMTGHYCLRKGGWDTHGLPVEVEVCKELGIHTKEEIERYGVEKFNKKCLQSVFRYTKEWEELTRRLGFWVNLDEAYVTYHQSYVESVWWALKTLFDAGVLYQGHKIVWWWAQGGTALSAGEVGQGYREVDDPSVYVRFPLVQDEPFAALFGPSAFGSAGGPPPEKVSLLVWTTTPWTLPSNMFAAVHPDFDYAIVVDEETGERLIFAAALVEQIAKKVKKAGKWKVERTVKGSELLSLRYHPPFDCYYRRAPAHGECVDGVTPHGTDTPYGALKAMRVGGGEAHICWRVLAADFVTLESGTGLVHEAPAFGEVDYDLMQDERQQFKEPESVPMLCAVAPNGTFSDEGPEYCRGRWVKDCDKDIIRDMKEREAYPGSGIPLLLHQETYRHDYPFCWRAEDDPLIQYPRRSWFIRTTQFKKAMLENNRHIHWLPEHIKTGRFGKFLESNVDWSLSRERYWGTPLPIWVCESCGHMEAVDSYDALVAKPGVAGLDVWENAKRDDPQISEHLKVHKPYIDAVAYDCPKCAAGGGTAARAEARGSSGRMRRVPEVIDCWFDSGAMPFAQWGYPHRGAREFGSQFPADFISEALDQTRGWFYSLTAIATMLFGKDGLARRGSSSSARPDASIPHSAFRIPHSDYPLPFRNCIVLGLLMGEDGLKMSKQKKNYKEPSYIFEHEGADAMRWLFFSGQTPWTSIRFQESAIAEGQREFLIRLYNCYSFFVIYANIDGWTPECGTRNAESGTSATAPAGNELDRWIRSELAACSVKVYDCMEAYDNFNAARALIGFVDALSNWYVRRSRERFWRSGMDDDKRAAYETLYDCLVTTAKLIAPFTPFLAEAMYQNLVVNATKPDQRSELGTGNSERKNAECGMRNAESDSIAARASRIAVATGGQTEQSVPASVHLCDYPVTAETRPAVERQIDGALNEEIEMVRQVVSCGRAARAAAKLRVRQPLARMELFHRSADLIRKHAELIQDELNVKRIDLVASGDLDQYVHYEVKPDFKKIGPKFGPLAPKIKAALSRHPNVDAIVKQLEQAGAYTLTVDGQEAELSSEELLVELHAREGWAAERIPGYGILVLDTHVTPELAAEGLARDLVNQIQQQRKALNLRYEQRIDLAVVGDEFVGRIVNRFASYIQGETLAQNLLNRPIAGAEPTTVDLDGHAAGIYVKALGEALTPPG